MYLREIEPEDVVKDVDPESDHNEKKPAEESDRSDEFAIHRWEDDGGAIMKDD